MEALRSRQWSADTLAGGLEMVDQHVRALKEGDASEESMRAELADTCHYDGEPSYCCKP